MNPEVFWRSEAEFAAAIERVLELGDLSRALEQIRDFVRFVITDQRSIAQVFSCRLLDQLCGRIGLTALEERTAACCIGASERSEDEPVVYLTTELSDTGGHTRFVEDLIRAERACKHYLLMTDLMDQVDANAMARRFGGGNTTLEIAARAPYLERLRWLQRRLRELNARKTYLLIHHHDAVAVAAVQSVPMRQVVYIHNCDHSLALGNHIRDAVHVDFHAKGFYNCRENEGVRNNVFWPLVAEDLGVEGDRVFMPGGQLTTCTSGGFEKFEVPHLRLRIPYLYSYADLVAQIIEAGRGTHLHIGPLSSELLDRIYASLDRRCIERTRFLHIPYVASLWRTLLEGRVDVYIGSFPLGGGRATVEALGSGTPMAIHRNYWSSFLCVSEEVPTGAMIWEDPAELIAYLRTLSPDSLRVQAVQAREHYCSHHHPNLLRLAIRRTELVGTGLPPPPHPLNRVNRMQQFLDLQRIGLPADFV